MPDTPHRRRIDIVTDPEFLANLESADLDELRRRRAMCDELDTELSYYRRVLHGRMDVLSFELRRRRGEETRSLVDALPEILAASLEREGSGASVRAVPIETPDIPMEGRRAVDRALQDDFLTRLPTVDDEELEAIQNLLAEVEAEVSRQRRTVYEASDAIHAELARRYREGLADIDGLLRSGG